MRRRRNKGRDDRIAARRAVEQAIGALYTDDRQWLAHLQDERARVERQILAENVPLRKRNRWKAEAAALDEDIKKVQQKIQSAAEH
ncbi:MAG TPA: hypothetical protein VNF02_04775 [Candidatus Limnocylindrales bacterium]|nr:hypothetical protein [Candidatus Limnocylindrales bacterium]